MLRGLNVLISCCVAVAVGDLGSDLDSELCQSDDCAAKQARTGLAAANDDDLQDPNTIAVKDEDEDEGEENDASDANNAFVRVRRGGCFDNKQHGKANRISLGGARNPAACAAKVRTNPQCTPYFEFDSYDSRTSKALGDIGYCGCSGVGGNECRGSAASASGSATIYRTTSDTYDSSSGGGDGGSIMNNGGSAAAVRGARLKRTLSGMLFATTRGASVAASFESGAALLQRWATAKGFATENELKKKLAYTAVTYIMTTTGEGRDTGMFLDLADTPEFDAVTVVIRVLPKRMTDYIDDKRIFGRLAKQAGVEGGNSAVPRTFESVADAVKVLGADPAASKHVFIKDTYGSGGTGVHVELTKNLKSKDFKLGDHQIIQEGVTNFALFEGRTVKVRAFVIAYRGRLYLSTYWNFHKGSAVYNPDGGETGNDLNGQFISQHFFHSVSKAEYWKENGGRVVTARDAPLRKEWTAGIAAAATSMLPMFDKILAATLDDPHRYHIFGLDAIPREDNSAQIIEINPFPNIALQQDLSSSTASNLQASQDVVYTPLLASVFRLLFGMQDQEDFIELNWKKG